MSKNLPINQYLPEDQQKERSEKAAQLKQIRQSRKALTENMTQEHRGEKSYSRHFVDGYSAHDLPDHRQYNATMGKSLGKNEKHFYAAPDANIKQARSSMMKDKVDLKNAELRKSSLEEQLGNTETYIEELKKKLGITTSNDIADYDPEVGEINLAAWRDSVQEYNTKNYTKKYKDFHAAMEKVIASSTETARDITVSGAGIKLDKKPVGLDIINHPNNTSGDVFEYERTDYAGKAKKMVGVRQKVLNDSTNAMHEPIQQLIKKRKQEGYRLATKKDFDNIIKILPAKNTEEGLLGIQILAGWFGRGVLDKISRDSDGNVSARSFVGLDRNDFDRNFFEGDNKGSIGSLFFVQDC